MKFNNRNVYISPTATIGKNVRIGDNTTVYDSAVIGDNTIIANDCVIGEPVNDYYFNENYVNPKTVIGENSLIRSHTIIYADCNFGKNFETGHRVTIREKAVFGDYCRVGTLSDIQGYATLGNHCWLLASVHICQKATIGNFVFIFPYVVLTNDPHPPSNFCIGPTVEDFSQIAVGAKVLPKTHIGKHVLVGANAVVGGKVEDYSLMMGNPAKRIKDVRDMVSRETGKPHYPWPLNFERRMPWEGEGFESWLAKQK